MDIQLRNEAINQLQTIRDVLRFGVSLFNQAGIFFGHGTDNAWDEALFLVLESLHLNHDVGEKILDARLTVTEREQIIALYQERISKRIPAPYLMNKAWFSGLSFYVDPRVLIPRSPIAELIERQFQPWIEADSVRRILDLGTGSACIAISCAYYFPDAGIDAVDIDEQALQVATLNVEQHRMQENVRLIKSDLFSALEPATYDIIIANPPYVDAWDMQNLPPEYAHEPRHALAAGDDGLDAVRIILRDAANYLTEQGILIVEVGNSAQALIDAYSHIPFLWLEFERGGEGVFILTREQLNQR